MQSPWSRNPKSGMWCHLTPWCLGGPVSQDEARWSARTFHHQSLIFISCNSEALRGSSCNQLQNEIHGWRQECACAQMCMCACAHAHTYTRKHPQALARLHTNSSPTHSDHIGKTAKCTPRPVMGDGEVWWLGKFLNELFSSLEMQYIFHQTFKPKTWFKANWILYPAQHNIPLELLSTCLQTPQ